MHLFVWVFEPFHIVFFSLFHLFFGVSIISRNLFILSQSKQFSFLHHIIVTIYPARAKHKLYAELKNKIETYRKLGTSKINGAKGNVIYILYKWHYHKEIHNTSEITHKITQKVVHTRQNIRCWSHFSVGSYTKLPYCNVGSLKFWQSYVLFFSNPFRMYTSIPIKYDFEIWSIL